MKKIVLSVGLLAGLGLGLCSGIEAKAENLGLENLLFRSYNPNSGEHFFTTDYAEASWLASQGWVGEQTAWSVPEKGDIVYRLYNPNAGDHIYTKSIVEYDWLAEQGWTQEGASFLSDTRDEVPVYRSYNKNALKAGAHMFTTSKSEHDGLINIGWNNEDISFYAESSYSKLEKEVAYCESTFKEEDYPTADFAEFEATLTTVKATLENPNSTKNDLLQASIDLHNAASKLLSIVE